MSRRILRRRLQILLGLALAIGLSGGFAYRYWPESLSLPRYRGVPEAHVDGGKIVIRVTGSHLAGEVARYEDELFAYLMFDYLRSRPALRNVSVLLSYSLDAGSIAYAIRVVLPNDFIVGIPALYDIANQFPFLTPDWVVLDDRVLRLQQSQSDTFVRAYNLPLYRKLEALSQKDLAAYARRFIRFKSNTDPRIRRQIEPIPEALSRDEAQQLAEDIVTVTKFYGLPLDFFLGIGAMENNYMNVKGDLGHAIWKKRAAKGDVILRRRGGRVQVLDESSGVWQITRETLRYAEALYRQDKRDYSELPAHLRPPHELNVGNLDPRILTTYAGLLFRDLLDRFHGDVGTAVGAYNGGPGNPNAKYEEGVTMVARYARRMLEQAAELSDLKGSNQKIRPNN